MYAVVRDIVLRLIHAVVKSLQQVPSVNYHPMAFCMPLATINMANWEMTLMIHSAFFQHKLSIP
ncbi:hypothetical protein D3C80_1606930 [compost metagenome]